MKKYESLLAGDYKVTYEEIVKELKIEEDLQFAYLDEVKNDLLDMLLQAQEQGTKIEKIIGNDYRTFCETIIKDFKANRSLKYKIIKTSSDIVYCIAAAIGTRIIIQRSINVEVNSDFILLIIALYFSITIAKKITLRKHFTKRRRHDYGIFRYGITIALAVMSSFFNSVYITSIRGSIGLGVTLVIGTLLLGLADKELRRN